MIIFGLIKFVIKSSGLSVLCIIICKKMKSLCLADLKVLGKLNYQGQVLVLSLESLENQSRSKLLLIKKWNLLN